MKKCLFVIALMTAVTFAANAQQKKERPERSPEKVAERITEKMAEELSLGEAQKKEVYDLNLESTKKRMDAMQKTRENRETIKEEMKADQQEHDRKMAEILTPEQMDKWKEYRKESMKKMRHNRGRSTRSPDGGK